MKRKLTKPQSLLLFLVAASSFFSSSAGSDTLTPTEPLVDGKTLISAGGRFEFGFFTPAGGNSDSRYVGIWYHNVSVLTVVWVANRVKPILSRAGNVSIDGKGTIIVSDQNNTVVWSSIASPGLVKPVAQLLDSGNLIVREADRGDGGADAGSVSWQSFDHPTDTVLPDMKFGWNPMAGLRNITSWASPEDPAPGEYVAVMDTRGYPQITLWGGSRLLWRSGPWNGLRFSGVPEQMNVNMFSFIFVDEPEEIYYMIKMKDPSILFRITVNESGISQGLVWIEESQIWNVFWSAPKDQCDAAAPCGGYGVCNPNDWPICHCIQGFEPKNPSNWALRDGSDGCRRKTTLDCRNRTDGFVKVSGAKLPDTSSSTVNLSLSIDLCKAHCLSNCSCTGYASANITTGMGCIFWFTDMVGIREYTMGGQDLFVRVAASDLGSGSEHRKRSVVISAVIGSGVALTIIAFVVIYVFKRRNRKRRALLGGSISFSESSINDQKSKDLDLPLYDLDTIVDATDNFSIQNKLGEGGFGPVYKGKLEGQEIAVKRLAKTSVQGIDEFKNEVMLIAKLQHRNLVRLLGCCIRGQERMLIYEYMHNKSLDAFIFDKAKSALLDWQTRYNIILGIARGLLYLHQDSRFRIIHRDLKASNILLDKDMNPKISDFGMARIFGGDETEVNTKRVVGTYGYMSPEYAMDGVFSVKSDVFSFGVLVLEIISGKRNRGVYLYEQNENLLGNAWSLWSNGHGLELVDQSIGRSYPMADVIRCIKVGLLCVQERPEDRPIMSSILLMLSSESSLLPQPKQPGFVVTKGPSETNSTSSKQTSASVNEISVTIFEGR